MSPQHADVFNFTTHIIRIDIFTWTCRLVRLLSLEFNAITMYYFLIATNLAKKSGQNSRRLVQNFLQPYKYVAKLFPAHKFSFTTELNNCYKTPGEFYSSCGSSLKIGIQKLPHRCFILASARLQICVNCYERLNCFEIGNYKSLSLKSYKGRA